MAWLLRDRISVDAWLILNQLDQQFSTPQQPSEEFRVSAAQDRLNHAIITLSAFGGLVMESMTRGDGWRFLDIGRRLERAIQMVELLRNGLPKEAFGGVGVLEAILEMADSSITYRSRYLTSVQVDLVLDLLLGGRSQSALHRFSAGAAARTHRRTSQQQNLHPAARRRTHGASRCSILCSSSMYAR